MAWPDPTPSHNSESSSSQMQRYRRDYMRAAEMAETNEYVLITGPHTSVTSYVSNKRGSRISSFQQRYVLEHLAH